MNVEIIPAINAKIFEEVAQKVKLIEPYTSWIHLDVADGTFTKNTLWHNPADLASLETNLNLEVHLMINDVERRIDDWLVFGVKRIIFHIRGSKDPDFVIKKCKEEGVSAGISISPDESLAKAAVYKDRVDFFQILSVKPGLTGQKTDENAFDRVREVRKFCPLCIIEIDGGMNKETIPRAVEAGANKIVAASAIFNDKDVGENIKELKSLCRI